MGMRSRDFRGGARVSFSDFDVRLVHGGVTFFQSGPEAISS